MSKEAAFSETYTEVINNLEETSFCERGADDLPLAATAASSVVCFFPH